MRLCCKAMLLYLSICLSPKPRAEAQSNRTRTQKGATATSSAVLAGDARAVVVFFIASDCPISNRQLPEMLRIEREFATRHVLFRFVYPNTSETPATIRAHRAAYGIPPDTFAEQDRQLQKLTGANVTPEAAVLVPGGVPGGTTMRSVYTGRIDDRYLSLGTERPAATRHDLEDAITALLANRPVPPPGGPPVGCAFMTLAPK